MKIARGEKLKTYYKYDPKRSFENSFRKPIFDRDGYECQYCQTKEAEKYVIEHVLPVSKGGGFGHENLVVSCSKCNYKKRTRIWIPKNFIHISANNLDHQKFVLENAVQDFR